MQIACTTSFYIYKILEIKENNFNKKDAYYVMIAGSNNFDNYTFFEEKCKNLQTWACKMIFLGVY